MPTGIIPPMDDDDDNDTLARFEALAEDGDYEPPCFRPEDEVEGFILQQVEGSSIRDVQGAMLRTALAGPWPAAAKQFRMLIEERLYEKDWPSWEEMCFVCKLDRAKIDRLLEVLATFEELGLWPEDHIDLDPDVIWRNLKKVKWITDPGARLEYLSSLRDKP
jgi:hypothetical protein